MAQTNGRGFQGIDPDRISNETGRSDDSRAPQQQNKQQDYSQDKSRKMGGMSGSKSDSHERAAFHHETAGFHHRQAAQHTQNGNHGTADLHTNAADKHGRAAWDHSEQAQRYGSQSGMSRSNSQGTLNRDRDDNDSRDVSSYQGRDQDRDLGRQDKSAREARDNQDDDRDLESNNNLNPDDTRRSGRSRETQHQKS